MLIAVLRFTAFRETLKTLLAISSPKVAYLVGAGLHILDKGLHRDVLSERERWVAIAFTVTVQHGTPIIVLDVQVV
jgi:hypothetical protein